MRPFLVLLALLAWQPLDAQQVQVYLTSQAGDRIAPKPALRFAARAPGGGAVFRIHEEAAFQRIDGFGASLLEAGLICLNSLDPPEQEKVLRTLFDARSGSGFSAMKTVLAGTDFMSAGPWYTYDDTPGDVELKHFSIARDLGPNGEVTFIKRARRYGQFALQAPMDYPPDWMLFDVHKNQDVDPRYFEVLAHYYLRYLRAYEEQGILIDYLSLFNEPGVYTKIPYTKIRDLLKNHVGPLFAREGVKTRIQLSEAPERRNAWRNYPTVLDDPAARKYVAVAPYHGYGFKDYDLIAQLSRRYPGLPFWMTEICYAYEAGYKHTQPRLPRVDYEDGDFWGNQIFSDLEAGASAWIYWNLILDEKGGPWLVSPIHGNPDPNEQHPVVIVNRGTRQVIYTGLFYYLSHFSKFVRPGAVRVETTGSAPQVRAMTFRAPDGKRVAEVMNSRREPAQISLVWQGKTLAVTLPPLSIGTYLW
ncbi:MAG TPA: glycoside hydrolase family 30 beta sandwich domain-containing protein [Bryobacteraceae bacterium]|nr:glycoside hydrolase family 30 beta sandwich domain-containing protein [Bryobacteraceae bacterium]